MPETPTRCPDCGAPWTDGQTCEDDFHQMLFWEAEFPALGVVHHLMVLCYHLQHPSRYSPEALQGGILLLRDFLNGRAPQDSRQRMRANVDSSRRAYKIAGTPDAHGTYQQPVAWTITAHDVVAGGWEGYIANTWAWARAVYAALEASDNPLPPPAAAFDA